MTVLNSEKRNPRSEAHAEILSRVSWRIVAAICGLDYGREMLCRPRIVVGREES